MSKRRRINEIITYYGKGVTPRYVLQSSIIVLNQKCIRNNKIDYSFAQFIDDTKEYNENKLLREGDILINSTGQGTAGRVAFVDKIPDGYQLIVDSHILVLRTKNFYESRCLNYNLFSIEKMLQTFIDGSTGQGEFDRTRLFNIKLNYSENLSEQKRISSVLYSLETKIEINQKINVELEAMARTLYDYWFVQFDFPDKDGKPYKSSGGKMGYNEQLKRDIPVGWESNNILKIAELLGGGTPQTQNSNYWNGNIPFFTPSDADTTIYKVNTKDFITLEGLNNSSTKLFNKGTIFITARGSVGNIMIAGREMAMNQSCYALKPKDSGYIFLYFSAISMVGYLKVKSSGSVFKSIVSNDIKFTPLLIPKNEVRKSFDKIVTPLFEQILSNLNQNYELTKLRNWLLPMLMNGQVKVADRRIEKNGLVTVAAETMPGNINQTSLAIPANKKGFAKQVLAGKIVSLFKSDPNFTEIKFQKIQFLAEHIAAADLNLNYYYQAAGPYDNKFMHTIHDSFKKSKWFDWKNKQYIPLEKQNKIDDFYQGYFQPVQGLLETLFELLSNATEAESEIIATIYAVWNNRIIDGKSFKDDDLIQDFYNWSERKQKYSEKQIMKGLEWLRINQMEPKGFGKVIKKAKRKSK